MRCHHSRSCAASRKSIPAAIEVSACLRAESPQRRYFPDMSVPEGWPKPEAPVPEVRSIVGLWAQVWRWSWSRANQAELGGNEASSG